MKAGAAMSEATTIPVAAGPTYGVEIVRDVMVPMRDGVPLATDLYLPRLPRGGDPGERFPALLQRTPYSKEGASSPHREVQPPTSDEPGPDRAVATERFARFFAERGYAVVIQDVRGRFQSEGRWRMLVDDGRDGVDTCAWIATRPWSDGKVGTYGTSYAGGTQHAIALEGAPQLKTAIPVDAMSNLWYQSLRNGGAFEMRFWNWIFTWAGRGSSEARDGVAAPALREMWADRRTYLSHLPVRRGVTPLKHSPEYENWLVEAMSRGPGDPFWDINNIRERASQYQDMPVYLVGGWYDSWAGNTTANFRALKRAIEGPVYLIMGPWIHGQQGASAHGQVSFGPDAAIPDPLAWRLEWFDHWLKGVDNSVGKAAPFATPVRIFVMGTGDGSKTGDGRLNHGGSWRDEQEWPLPRTRLTPLYLRAGGLLAPEPEPEAESSTIYDFDPRDPVPTIGGNISSAVGILLQGAWDQRGGEHVWNWLRPIPLSARRDVLVFQTEPLAEDIEVTGEIEVRLWASSSAVDTDFTAKLIDVYPASVDFPGGFDLNLEDGIIRGRFRESLKHEKLLEPGVACEFTIHLYPTSNVFKKGHRIRVDVSSSNFPRFDLNPNSGEPLGRHRRIVVATNTVFHDRGHPSRIILPVIPASD